MNSRSLFVIQSTMVVWSTNYKTDLILTLLRPKFYSALYIRALVLYMMAGGKSILLTEILDLGHRNVQLSDEPNINVQGCKFKVP